MGVFGKRRERILRAAPVLNSRKKLILRQHRTCPCKKRKGGPSQHSSSLVRAPASIDPENPLACYCASPLPLSTMPPIRTSRVTRHERPSCLTLPPARKTWSWRHGRRLQGGGPATGAHGGPEIPSGGRRTRSAGAGALQTRGTDSL